MKKPAPASEVSRSSFRISGTVAAGDGFAATSDGRADAPVVPNREAARRLLLDHLRSLPVMNAAPFDRDDAYE